MEIVQDGQKLFYRARNGKIAEVRPLALLAFAGILKFSLQTRQPIYQLVALGFKAIDLALQLRFSAADLGCLLSSPVDGLCAWIAILLCFVGDFTCHSESNKKPFA